MKVYVAGASSEMNERARPMMQALTLLGYEITHDWTKIIDEFILKFNHEQLSLKDPKVHEYFTKSAKGDLKGVRDANVLILLAPQASSTGAWTELGYALALQEEKGFQNYTIFVSGNIDKSIFCFLPQVVKFDTDRFLLNHFIELMGNYVNPKLRNEAYSKFDNLYKM